MPSTVRALAAGMLIVVAGAARPVNAQPPPEAPRPRARAAAPASADSSRILRRARSAQSRFEAVRRQHLPRTWGSRGGPCEEIIGRFCYWDDGEPHEDAVPEPIPAESPKIVDARNTLLSVLDSTSRDLPGDDWIAAQHVRYLLEAGHYDPAVERGRTCEGTSWWCEALEALALHASGSYAESDSVFTLALATMPADVRCEWIDLETLLAGELRARYPADCEARRKIADRLWWLADPLHSQPGNDRRSEHYARLVLDRLQERTPSGYGLPWGDDLEELLARYGWPSYFAREIPAPFTTEAPGILSHHRDPSYHFLPDGEDLRAIGEEHWTLRDIREESWTLRAARQRERYAPPYATFASLAQLTTLFRRGDSVLIVSAYDVRRDTLMPEGPIAAALVASAGPPPAMRIMTIDRAAPRRGSLRLIAPDTALLASIEVGAGDRMRRARLGVGYGDALSSRVRISGLGLFDPGDSTTRDSLPADVDTFAQRARTSSRVSRDEKLGLYWELYGALAGDDRLATRVELIREGGGWLRRVGERIGLLTPGAGVRLGWREAPREVDGIVGRAVVIDPGSLDPGRYTIEVHVSLESELPVIARRSVEIIR